MKETIDSEADWLFSRPVSRRSRQIGATGREVSAEVNKTFLPGTFLREVDSEMRRHYRHDSRTIGTHLRSRLVQFWLGIDRAVHYEVWIHERTAQMEIGLHFESTASRNRELYRRFEGELLAIQAALGGSIWLEEWEKGWSRIYETQELWPLDSARVASTADRLSEMITTFQPLLDD